MNCLVCSDRKLPANHRTGSKTCTLVQKYLRGVRLNVTIPNASVFEPTPNIRKEGRRQVLKEGSTLLPRIIELQMIEVKPGRIRSTDEEDGTAKRGNKKRRLKASLEEENPNPATMKVIREGKEDSDEEL